MSVDELKVAIVTPRYPPLSTGGGERSAQLLASALADSDQVDAVTVLSFDGNESGGSHGVRLKRLGAVSSTVTEYQNLRAAPKLYGRLSEFDVIHGYNMELHPIIGFLSDYFDIPSVATLNSYHFFPSSVTNTAASGLERLYEQVGYPTTGRVLRHYMKRIDVFIALSQAISQVYRRNGFDNVTIKHIPNMIDPAFDVPQGNPTEGYQLLYVGTLTENKGVRYLLEALSMLPDSFWLRVVGDGDRRFELEAHADRLGVDNRTEFTGWIDYERIGQAYADADMFVHPGIWPEPLNRTLLEAMQAGLPVVCTDIGGPPEFIPNEEVLCEPGDPEALASTIQRVQEDDSEIGSRNLEHVIEICSPSAVISRYIHIYEQLS